MGIHPISNKLRDNNEPYAIHDSRRNSRWHPCQHRIIIAAFRLFQKSKNNRIRHEKIVTYPAVLPMPAIYGISTIPANLLIDPQGKIIAADLRERTLTKRLESILK